MMKRKWKQWIKNSAAFALAVIMVLQTGVSASVYASSPETAVTVEADENGEQENAFEAVNEDLTAEESGLPDDAEISEDSETDQESGLPAETDTDEAEAESEDESVESEDEATASDAETDEVTMEDEFAEEEAATVLADTEATEADDYSYGFTVSSWSSSSIFKKYTQYSRNEDGTNTFTAEFLTTADETWIDENITFTVENVMPPAYTNMFETMGVDVSTLDYTVSSVTSSKIKQYAYYGFGVIEPFTEDGPGDTTQEAVSGKTFKITTGMGIRAVKVSAIMNGEVIDCIYLGTSGYSVSTPHTESELDAELYRQVRIRIENQLWTDDMTNLEKLNALADYIKSSTRYPNTAATSSNYEVNAQFVADFYVDNGFYLYYNMFSDSNISYAMALQGGVVTCYAANILYDAAIEELGLTDIYSSDGTVLDQEGVYLGAGSLSSNPTNSSHVSLIYYDADGNKYYIDAQGKTAAGDYSANILSLKVEEKLEITEQPQSVEVNCGDKVTFSVTATGSGDISYQWYYKKTGATAWSKWYTKASFSATSSDTWDGMQVYCVVTDENGNAVTSDTATITFIEAVLAITTQPQSVSISSGDKVTFGVTVTKSDVSYQWYYKKSGATAWSKWYTKQGFIATSGSTWDGMQVYCVVTDTEGNSVSSDIATISFAADLEITQQPQSVSISSGDKVTFGVTVTKSDVSYQWYYKKSGATAWSKWYTKQSFTATSGSTWDGMQVYCVVTDTEGNSVESDIATITFVTALKITEQPQSVTISSGDKVTFSVTASDSNVSYQWYYKKTGADTWTKWYTKQSFTAISGSTWDGMQVYCVVTDENGNTVESDIAVITFQ